MKVHSVITIFSILIALYQIEAQNTKSDGLPDICPSIVPRSRWNSSKPKTVDYIIVPTKKVVISHTMTDECYTMREKCSPMIAKIQKDHMENLHLPDIQYNFLVTGDGIIYEGLGWHKTSRLDDSIPAIRIGLIGTNSYFYLFRFIHKKFGTIKNLLDCGIQLGELDKNYGFTWYDDPFTPLRTPDIMKEYWPQIKRVRT